jgi:hypothetical protein
VRSLAGSRFRAADAAFLVILLGAAVAIRAFSSF